MSPYEMSIPTLIQKGTTAVTNLESEAELQALLEPYGYDAAEIAVGRALLDDLKAKAAAKTDGYGLQYAATDALEEARATFHSETYMDHVQIARRVFRREPAVLARLRLNEERRRAFGAWHEQAFTFYTNLGGDPALVAQTTPRNLTEPMITDALATLADLDRAEAAQENRKGLAQGSTDDRDLAARAFADWYADLREYAEVALRVHPEWLERLGFLHRNDGDPN